MARERILAIDVGTGTQDILILEAGQEIENALQLVLPSPTLLVAQQIEAATAQALPLILTGVTMGGGPCAWAAEAHLRAGYAVHATPAAARTFDDDLSVVAAMGVRVISDDESRSMSTGARVVLRDFMPEALSAALGAFGISDRFDACALAAFDHGAAPPGYSDRRFRFDFLRDTIGRGADMRSFAYLRDTLPMSLTRLQALGSSVRENVPTVLMDTGAAALLGAQEDPRVRRAERPLIANIGNFHTLAFAMEGPAVRAVFEHHTGLLDRVKLDRYLGALADGTLDNETIFADNGHGALQIAPPTGRPDLLAVTGPRRRLISGSPLDPYLAVPHGDMMLCGCFGLLRGLAHVVPAFDEMVSAALGQSP